MYHLRITCTLGNYNALEGVVYSLRKKITFAYLFLSNNYDNCLVDLLHTIHFENHKYK